MRPLLVGEAPAPTTPSGAPALSGRSARVLCEQIGLEAPDGDYCAALLPLFDRANLFGRLSEAQPWSAPRARDQAHLLLSQHEGVVVCLGRKVQAAIGGALDAREMRLRSSTDPWAPGWFGSYGAWWRNPSIAGVSTRRLEVVTLPHPSGLNRLLNDPAAGRRCGEVLQQALVRAAAAGR